MLLGDDEDLFYLRGSCFLETAVTLVDSDGRVREMDMTLEDIYGVLCVLAWSCNNLHHCGLHSHKHCWHNLTSVDAISRFATRAGRIPTEIGHLDRLTVCRMGGNEISGA